MGLLADLLASQTAQAGGMNQDAKPVQSFTPAEVAQMKAGQPIYRGGWAYQYSDFGAQSVNQDGSSYSFGGVNAINGFNLAVNQSGGLQTGKIADALYGDDGQVQRIDIAQDAGAAGLFKETITDLGTIAAMFASFYAAGVGLAGVVGAAGAGSAAGMDASLAVQGNSINALDAATGVGYGSEAAATVGAGTAASLGGTAATASAGGLGSLGSALGSTGLKAAVGAVVTALGGGAGSGTSSASAPARGYVGHTVHVPGTPPPLFGTQQSGGLSLPLLVGIAGLALLALHG